MSYHYHDSLQHRFLFFTPARKVEEPVHEIVNIAKVAILHFETELSLGNVTRFSISKSTGAALIGMPLKVAAMLDDRA
jgi:hypothetical protein